MIFILFYEIHGILCVNAGALREGNEYMEKREIKEDWGVYMCRFDDGKPASIRVNMALAEEDLKEELPARLQLSVYFQMQTENGLPMSEEAENLYAIEDAMAEILSERDALLVGFVRWDNRLSIFAYAKSASGFEQAFSDALQEKFPSYSYRFWEDDDPDWEGYYDTLYPNSYAYQGIQNDRVIRQLEAHGDAAEIPRVLEHTLCFRSKEGRRTVLEKLLDEGFRKLGRAEEEEKSDREQEYPFVLAIGREDSLGDVDEITWKLMDLSEEFDGYYDGWGCVIVRRDA